MIFQNKNILTLTLKIDNIDTEQVIYFNFLGLIIHTNLKWKKNTENISNACSKQIGTLIKLKHMLPLYIKNYYIIHQ